MMYSFKFTLFLYLFLGVLQFSRCYIYLDCNLYCNKDSSTLTATQMVIVLLLVFGFFFAILIYCKTCNRDAHQRYSAASNDNINCRSLQSNSIYELSVNRPPAYNEVCSAPPLYESPFNSVSMFEAPPVYPETSQQSRVSHPFNQTVPITNYI